MGEACPCPQNACKHPSPMNGDGFHVPLQAQRLTLASFWLKVALTRVSYLLRPHRPGPIRPSHRFRSSDQVSLQAGCVKQNEQPGAHGQVQGSLEPRPAQLPHEPQASRPVHLPWESHKSPSARCHILGIGSSDST